MPVSTALDFSAALSRVDCGAQLPTPANLTFIVWANLGSTGGGTGQGIVARTTNRGLGMNVNVGDAFEFLALRATTSTQVTATAANFKYFATSKWVCIVSLFSAAGVNADQQILIGDLLNYPVGPSSYSTQLVGSGNLTAWDANLAIGAWTSTGSLPLVSGKIAAVGIWNKVLSFTEIQKQRFELLKRRFVITPNCQGFWQLGRGTGPQVDWSRQFPAGLVTNAVSTAGIPHNVWG